MDVGMQDVKAQQRDMGNCRYYAEFFTAANLDRAANMAQSDLFSSA